MTVPPFNFVLTTEYLRDVISVTPPIFDIEAQEDSSILVSHVKEITTMMERMSYIRANYFLLDTYEQKALFGNPLKPSLFKAICKQINIDYNIIPHEKLVTNMRLAILNPGTFIPEKVVTNILEYYSFLKLDLDDEIRSYGIILPTMIPYIKFVFAPIADHYSTLNVKKNSENISTEEIFSLKLIENNITSCLNMLKRVSTDYYGL